jgi:hypothetical protein
MRKTIMIDVFPSSLLVKKISIIYQIQSGRLETTAQAIYFINSILSNPIHPKTVRRALQGSGLWSATKKKVLYVKANSSSEMAGAAPKHGNWTVDN